MYLGPLTNSTWYEAEARAVEMDGKDEGREVEMLRVENELEQRALLRIKDCEWKESDVGLVYNFITRGTNNTFCSNKICHVFCKSAGKNKRGSKLLKNT